MKPILTTVEVAAELNVPLHRARYAIRTLGIEAPRCGPSRMIPREWLPRIRAALQEDRRKRTDPQTKRPQPRLERLSPHYI